uniref:SHSP domain-containing protein n=1 Tax=Labrus bergylta TaxID=56723 RepID=A0A3Q3G4X9_9LABR
MLCTHGLQSALSPFMDSYWSVGSLCPEVKPLFYHRLKLMDKLQHNILEETEPFQTSVVIKPVSYQLDKEGEHFGLTLDTEGFSPEELSVRQVGKKLRVSGKTEKKQEDGKGCSSYTLQEFRQEFDLPEGLNPEAVTCYLAPDGKLHIHLLSPSSVFPNSNPLLFPLLLTSPRFSCFLRLVNYILIKRVCLEQTVFIAITRTHESVCVAVCICLC